MVRMKISIKINKKSKGAFQGKEAEKDWLFSQLSSKGLSKARITKIDQNDYFYQFLYLFNKRFSL